MINIHLELSLFNFLLAVYSCHAHAKLKDLFKDHFFLILNIHC